MVFTGTYRRALDGKLRVLLPKRLRSSLTDADLYLTPGTDHCLELHTSDSLNRLAIQASQSSSGTKNIRSFSRLFYARAEPCDVDKQGRIRIPQSLAELADLDTELVIVGVGFHWELWKLELWESYLNQHHDAFDQISQATFDPPAMQAPRAADPTSNNLNSSLPIGAEDKKINEDEHLAERSEPRITPK